MPQHFKHHFAESIAVKQAILADASFLERLETVTDWMVECFQLKNKLLLCGNGGSTCDALHIAEELTGRYKMNRPALGAIAIAEASHITCTANDFGFAHVFERGVEALGRKGDVLFALSTSGNSENVVLAAKKAQQIGMKVIAFTGKTGGELQNYSDILLNVPSSHTAHIQEAHITIGHMLIAAIENQLFSEKQ